MKYNYYDIHTPNFLIRFKYDSDFNKLNGHKQEYRIIKYIFYF